MKTTIIAAAALGLPLAGCAHLQDRTLPASDVPNGIIQANAPPAATPLSRVVADPVDLTRWWAQFRDPELDRLIALARVGNLDRQTAASRVRQARAAAAQTRAAELPTVAGNVGAYHTRLSENVAIGSSSAGGESGGQGADQTSGGAVETDVFVLGLLGNYSPDLFGAKRAATRAARERLEAQAWSAHDTEVTLASEVATAYFALRAAQRRLVIIQANVRSQSRLLDILIARARGGLTNDIDAARQRNQLALVSAQLPMVESEVASQRHQIELLLGRAPDSLEAELAPRGPGTSIPALPPIVPVGLPSTIMERRPDIRQAERTLAAALSGVDQKTADLFPKIQLTALPSLVSSALSDLLKWSSRTLIGGATGSFTLFDGGARSAARRQAEEEAVQAKLAYRQAVLNAFSEVAGALNRYAADQRRLTTLQAGYGDARRTADLNRSQYIGGLTDLTATLQTEATAFQTEDQLAQAQGQALADLIALYKALGGGWDPREGTPFVSEEQRGGADEGK